MPLYHLLNKFSTYETQTSGVGKTKDWIGYKKGYLNKTKEKNRAVFFKKTRRHFTLVNEFMVYRNSHTEAFPKAAYNLLSVNGIGIVGRNSFVMDFEDGTRSGVLVATSHTEATLWVQAIRARIQFIKTPEFVSKRNERKLIRRMSSNLIDLDLNDDFKNVTHRRNRTEDNWLSLFDSLFDSPTAAASSTNKTNKKESKRQYIIAEIMSTEQNYVDSLKSLMNVYVVLLDTLYSILSHTRTTQQIQTCRNGQCWTFRMVEYEIHRYCV